MTSLGYHPDFLTQAPHRLTVEMVPASKWRDNLRALMSDTQWSQVSHLVSEQASHTCVICGARWPSLECHERWRYTLPDSNDPYRMGYQELAGLDALCKACHLVKHLGFATSKLGFAERSFMHLATVNGTSLAEAKAYAAWAFDEQRKMSRCNWQQDILWFKEHHPGRLRSERPKVVRA